MIERGSLQVFPVIGESGRFHVASAGRSGLLYLVDLDELDNGWCGCPHFEYKIACQLVPTGDCKHIRAARLYTENVVNGTE